MYFNKIEVVFHLIKNRHLKNLILWIHCGHGMVRIDGKWKEYGKNVTVGHKLLLQ